MACAEHHCTKCDWFEMDNGSHKYCPNCGASKEFIRSYFDEEIDHKRDEWEAKHGPIDEESENSKDEA